jgi:hypothetical protein
MALLYHSIKLTFLFVLDGSNVSNASLQFPLLYLLKYVTFLDWKLLPQASLKPFNRGNCLPKHLKLHQPF